MGMAVLPKSRTQGESPNDEHTSGSVRDQNNRASQGADVDPSILNIRKTGDNGASPSDVEGRSRGPSWNGSTLLSPAADERLRRRSTAGSDHGQLDVPVLGFHSPSVKSLHPV